MFDNSEMDQGMKMALLAARAMMSFIAHPISLKF